MLKKKLGGSFPLKNAIVSAMNLLQYTIVIHLTMSKDYSYESYISCISSYCKMLPKSTTKSCFIQMPDDLLQSDFEALRSLSSR